MFCQFVSDSLPPVFRFNDDVGQPSRILIEDGTGDADDPSLIKGDYGIAEILTAVEPEKTGDVSPTRWLKMP